ncbi:HAD-IA family hydrolase [candidate division KSB1 bacterium]|nr:HAD-IA family hydrolase [candidate division KSB1 bacterium]
MVKVIIFDLGGVLIELSYDDFFNSMSQETGLSITELSNQKASKISTRFQTGSISGEQLHAEFCELFNINISLHKLKEIWAKVLAGQKKDVAEIVSRLQKIYPMTLLSNTDPWHFEYCRKHFSVVRTFEKAFLSYEQHLLKPDPEFYKQVSQSLGVHHDECLFIDDTEVNVKSAKDVGYNVIHFKDASQLKEELINLNINPFSSN